ncbi:MAG: enoyl-CoA hydratase-related protein [Gemmatimonadota bacterium]
MTYTTLLFDVRDAIAFITINRPDKLNALNQTVITELSQAAEVVVGDPAIKAAILTGAGPKSFVAGADISGFDGLDALSARALSMRGQAVFRRFEQCRKPVVAAVNGFALGGGCELAMACHFRYASENAKFGQPEVKLGIIPGYGGTIRLPRLIGRGRAIELILTGSMIDAQEAYRIGLVNRVFPQDQLLAETEKTVRAILDQGPLAVAACIDAINAQENMHLDDALAYEATLFTGLFASHDVKEGTKAFLEKRKPVYKGA